MSPATHPSIVNGSISRWVTSGPKYFSSKAIRVLFSSFTSTYSISPSLMKSLKVQTPILSSSKWMDFTFGIPFSTMIKGQTSLPASQAILIDL